MYVYVVSYGIAYEGEQLIGVFSDYVKARQYQLDYSSRFGVSIEGDGEWIVIRKVELDRAYNGLESVGEEV